jgi:Tol biopolymer transport system component
MPDGSGLLVQYQAGIGAPIQIGFLSYPGAKFSTVTRDTNTYPSFSLAANGNMIAAVQSKTTTELALLGANGAEAPGSTSPLASEKNIGAMSWDSNDAFLLAEGGALLRVSTDGRSRTTLIQYPSNSGMAFPTLCDGGRSITFSWFNHAGSKAMNIWSAGADGSNPVQLTHGTMDLSPVCSPDGKWVYFTRIVGGNAVVEKVPFSGSGEAKPVPETVVPDSFLAANGGFAISPDGKQIGSVVSILDPVTKIGAMKLALADLGSSQPPHLIPMNQNFYPEGHLMFTEDGKAVAYVVREKGVDNVWVQPLTGSAGHQLTHFENGQIRSFDWSPDGKKLAVLRSHTTSDVVLLRSANP